MASAACFNDDNFDTETYLKDVLKRNDYETEAARLGEAVASVEKQLHKQVSESFPRLKEQLSTVHDLDKRVEVLQVSAGQLQQSVSRARNLLTEPYTQVEHKVHELKNIWGTTDLLRRLGKILSLVARVRAHQAAQAKAAQDGRAAAASLDLPKEARTLRDIEVLLAETNVEGGTLRGIDVVEREVEWVHRSTDAVKARAHELLKHGLATMNQAELRTAVQAFYNLDMMTKVVQKVVADSSQEIRKTVARELDVQGIVAAANHAEGSEPVEAKTRAAVFGRLDGAFHAMLQHVSRMSQLVRVLQRTRNPANQKTFFSQLQPDFFADEVWRPVMAMEERVSRLARRFTVLVAEFPRLHNMFEAFVQNVAEHFPEPSSCASDVPTQSAAAAAAAPAPATAVRDVPPEVLKWKELCLAETQGRYVKASFDRLNERVTAVVQKMKALQPRDAAYGGAPIVQHLSPKAKGTAQQLASVVVGAQLDLRPFFAAVAHELTAVQTESRLQQPICSNIESSVADLLSQARSMQVTARSAFVVGSVATNNQLFNAVLSTTLSRVHAEISQILGRACPELDDAATAAAKDSLLTTLAACEDEGLKMQTALFAAVEAHLEAPILDLLNVGNRSDRSPNGCNHCLAVLGDRWQQGEQQVLVLHAHPPSEGYRVLLRDMTQRLASLAVRLLATVRPLDEATRTNLVHDVANLQAALSSGATGTEHAPKAFKQLRAFRTLLTLDARQLNEALVAARRPDSVTLEVASLPSTVLLHNIFQRVAGLPALPALGRREAAAHARALATSEEYSAEVEQLAWTALKGWGEGAVAPEGVEEHTLLWECGQAWHKRRAQQHEHDQQQQQQA